MARNFHFIGLIGLLLALGTAQKFELKYEKETGEPENFSYAFDHHFDEQTPAPYNGENFCPNQYTVECVPVDDKGYAFCVNGDGLQLTENDPSEVTFKIPGKEDKLYKCQKVSHEKALDSTVHMGVLALNEIMDKKAPLKSAPANEVFHCAFFFTKNKEILTEFTTYVTPNKGVDRKKIQEKLSVFKTPAEFKMPEEDEGLNIQCFGFKDAPDSGQKKRSFWQRNYGWFILLVVGVIGGVGTWYYFYRDQNDEGCECNDVDGCACNAETDGNSNNDENKAKSDP